MTKDKKPQGKVVPELSKIEWGMIFTRVNAPVSPTGINMDEMKKRQSLFDKVVEGVPLEEDGETLRFNDKHGYDLYMTKPEWNILKGCFENTAWTSMWEARKGAMLLEKIENADDCDLIEKPLGVLPYVSKTA